MAALSVSKCCFGRRSFLFSLAGFGLTSKSETSEKNAEPVFRFITPVCEVWMSVQHFDTSSTRDFRFRDSLSKRSYCLSTAGTENQSCLRRFNGSVAIAYYHFRSRLAAAPPLRLRERVRMIDQDLHMEARDPFERVVAVERETASDIQAFGYSPTDQGQSALAKPVSPWALLRQDLFLNDQNAAFLTVHWKHTFELISLLDVIPGERTQILGG